MQTIQIVIKAWTLSFFSLYHATLPLASTTETHGYWTPSEIASSLVRYGEKWSLHLKEIYLMI